jgi:hypothetical protein
MANYDEIKKKAKDALETIADVSVEAYKIAEEKAKVFARKAKLNAEITREKTIVRRLKYDIGGMYYDLHKDDPEEAIKECCDAVTASLDSIAAKRCELEDLRRGYQCCEDAENFDSDPGDEDLEDFESAEPEPEPAPAPAPDVEEVKPVSESEEE